MSFLIAVLKWVTLFALALAGTFFAIRYPLLASLHLPEGLMVVADIAIVGLAVVSSLEVLIGLTTPEPLENQGESPRPAVVD